MSECVVWEGARHKQGYGWRRFQGKSRLAHRVAFFEANGYWPNVCRHTCDNPPCVNPDHLLDGTQADNVRDAVERGRHAARTLNPGMPNQRTDLTAYRREQRARQRAGTWVYKQKETT